MTSSRPRGGRAQVRRGCRRGGHFALGVSRNQGPALAPAPRVHGAPAPRWLPAARIPEGPRPGPGSVPHPTLGPADPLGEPTREFSEKPQHTEPLCGWPPSCCCPTSRGPFLSWGAGPRGVFTVKTTLQDLADVLNYRSRDSRLKAVALGCVLSCGDPRESSQRPPTPVPLAKPDRGSGSLSLPLPA